MKIFLLSLLIILLSSCNEVLIETRPEKVRVYINDKYLGLSPVRKDIGAFGPYRIKLVSDEGLLYEGDLELEINMRGYAPKDYYFFDVSTNKPIILSSDEKIVSKWGNTPKIKIAILDFLSKEPSVDGKMITELFTVKMLEEKKYTIIDRNILNNIIAEQKLELTGLVETSDDTLKVGKLAGADKMITGTLSKLGTTYILLVKGIDVATGIIEVTDSIKADELNLLLDKLNILTRKF